MEILVLGASGSIGRGLTAELLARGHTVRAASRTRRPATGTGSLRWLPVDLTSGTGVHDAVRGADAVVDLANVRSPRPSSLDAVLVEGTRRVLLACHELGDVRYVGISIVGIDEIPYVYYRAKLRQEQVIESGRAPWSLLRATQVHEFVDQILSVASHAPALVLPTGVRLQPIDVADVARSLADAAEQPAAGRLQEVGGPRVQTLGELAQEWLRARGQSKRVLRVPLPGRVGKALAGGRLTTPQHAVDGADFAQWLSESTGRPGAPS